MIPWTAEYVATIATQGVAERIIKAVEAAAESNTPAPINESDRKVWTAAEVLQVARDNAKAMYGV